MIFAVRHIRRAGPAIAFAPSLNLPAAVSVGIAQIAEAHGLVIQAVQFVKHLDMPEGQPSGLFRTNLQPFRRITAQNIPQHPLHDVERTANYGSVIGVGQRLWRIFEYGIERAQHLELAVHIMACFGLGSKRRPAQDHLLFADFDQVCQI